MIKNKIWFLRSFWALLLVSFAMHPTFATTTVKKTASIRGSSLMQSRTITGTVTDEQGGVLSGITVSVKGAYVSASTAADGKYRIDVPQGRDTLVISSVGYISQEIAIIGRQVVDVVLLSDRSDIDEVVVVGFGTQKKESVVASVSTIRGDQLRMPNRSLSNNLAGQLAGIIAVQRSGEPGYDNAEFWIRGISSFAGGTNPLVLVDGVPRQMNDIEPDEIETFTLLKDAAATSVYGSEGANGVILITSKRGRIQRPAISYRGEASRLTPTRIPKFANSFDFLSLYNEALRNDGEGVFKTDEELAKYASGEDPDLYPSVNWWDILMNDHTTNTRHTLNFRGGAERMRYFVSGAYFGESGLYIINKDYNNNAGLRRYNLRSNVDIDVTKSTKLSVDLSGQYLMTNYPSEQTSTLIQWFSQSPPYIIPHIYSDGTLAQKFGEFVNPYNRLMETGYRKEWRAGIQSKIQLEQKLDFVMRGLKARGIMSYDANSQYNMEREKSPETFYAEGRDPNGDLIFSTTANGSPFGAPSTTNSGDKNIYIETALNYDRTFAKHTVGGMALYYQKDRQLSNNALAYRKQAWIGRATYGFDNRYHIEGNFSVTGSEQFADGYRFGFFPAVGVAWNVTNEPFFPDNLKNAISNLKLRASIGRTGNDNTGGSRFMYRPTFDSSDGYSIGIGSSAPINNVGSGLIEGRFEAPYLSWEIELKRNYGIDLSVWRDMFTLQLDYFDNLRDNILMQRKTVSGTAGFRQTPWQNFGIVSNKGVDASLNMYKKVGEVGVALRGNFTYARNKILEYDEIPQPYPWMQVTGTRLLALRGMVAERLFREDDFHISIGPDGQKVYTLREGLAPYTGHGNPQPGDIKYVDQNGDGVVDTYADIVQDYMHPTVPEIMYGFGVNLDYSGFYFNIFFQGAGNVSLNLNNSQAQFSPFYEGIVRGSIRQEFIDSRWTEDNPSQNVFAPRITLQGRGNSYSQVNTWWYRDASFLRLKNIEVGYNFKPAFLDRLKIRSTRVYAMGQNVAVWDKIKMFDPEMGSSGAGTRYPLPSIWTVGLDFTF